MVNFILGGELLGDVKTGKSVTVVGFPAGIALKPTDIEFQDGPVRLRQSEPGSILKHLLPQAAY